MAKKKEENNIEVIELFKECLDLHKKYKYNEEKNNLQKFVQINPSDVSNFIETYNKTKGYNDREAEVFHSLSCILIENQLDNAIKSLKKAIELDPFRISYHEELFNRLSNINPEEAIASIKKAICLNPNRKSLYQDLIIILKEINLNEEATKISELIQDFSKNILCLVSYIEESAEASLLGLEN